MKEQDVERSARAKRAEVESPKNIKVLIVDRARFTCGLVRSALEQYDQFEIACSCPTPDDVSAAVATFNPDILLVSWRPEDGSPEAMKMLPRIMGLAPSSRGIILLDDGDENAAIECFRAGAKGVFRRSQPPEYLARCVQAVHEGQVWATSSDLNRVLQAFGSVRPLQCVNANGENLLSPREKQVVESIAEGLSNQEIAKVLGIAEHTVKNHLFKIYNKLGISTRVELILFAITRHGAG